MDRVTVRLGEPADALAIVALVEDYYARRGATPQYREAGTWYVAEIAGQICAAQNWLDVSGERWLQDTYCYDTRRGQLALAAIVRFTHAKADEQGVTLMGFSELDNTRVGAALEARGWVPIGILRRRLPGAARKERIA